MKKNNMYKFLLPIIFVVACWGLFSIYYTTIQAISHTSEENQIDLSQYFSVYSYGDNLKEIYTNPVFGIYIYLCPKNSENKKNVNLFNGIYIDKPTAKVNNNTVQNIFIFDKFPDTEKFENILDYRTLINTIIEQKPIMGFHRCYIKFHENYYNQAFTYEKDRNQYIFYDGAFGNWQAKSSSNKEFTVQDTSEYTGGMWDYKEKKENTSLPSNSDNMQNKSITFEDSPQLQAQYKAEIEKTINNGVIKAKKEIDKEYNEANNFYLSVIENDNYTEETFDKMESYTRGLVDSVFWLYVDLEKITEKYTNKKASLGTDCYWVIADYVEPIMKKYNVNNLNKLTILIEGLDEKYKELETRTEGIRKIIYGEN